MMLYLLLEPIVQTSLKFPIPKGKGKEGPYSKGA